MSDSDECMSYVEASSSFLCLLLFTGWELTQNIDSPNFLLSKPRKNGGKFVGVLAKVVEKSMRHRYIKIGEITNIKNRSKFFASMGDYYTQTTFCLTTKGRELAEYYGGR